MMKSSQIKALFPSEELLKPIPKFAFDIAYQDLPTTLGIDMIIDNITYHYEFSFLGEKVVHELLTKKYRRTEKILERLSPSFQDITVRSELKSFEDTKRVVKEDALCLGMAAMLNNDFANMLVDTIKEINVFNMTAPRLNPGEMEAFSEERIAKYVKILQKADPTIRRMHVEYEEEEVARQKVDFDDFENREIIQTILQNNEIECELTENGLECINKLLEGPSNTYNAIIMDVHMPIMDGISATKIIRKGHKEFDEIPIIAMTADAFKEDINNCLEAGMDAHLAKPINVKVLLDLLYNLTENK